MPSSKDPYRKQNETVHGKCIKIFKICNIRVSIFNFLFHISPITRDWEICPAAKTVHSQHSILSFPIPTPVKFRGCFLSFRNCVSFVFNAFPYIEELYHILLFMQTPKHKANINNHSFRKFWHNSLFSWMEIWLYFLLELLCVSGMHPNSFFMITRWGSTYNIISSTFFDILKLFPM